MFRDREEELERLQAELLEEEEQETAEELLEEETVEQLLEGEEQGENPEVYRNFSNDYGSSLRNFASGYKAYNTDKVDADLEELSRDVMEPPRKKRNGCLPAFLFFLLTAALLAVLWFVAKKEGLL